MTSRSDGRALAILAVAALGLARAGSLAAQVETPIPALLEPDFLLSVGDVVDPDRWRDAATVVGSSAETGIADRSHAQYDLVYVPRVVEGRSLSAGDAVQLFRIDRRIDDPATLEPLGRLLLPTGTGLVDSLAGETARVRISDAFHPILLGDRVRNVSDAMRTWPAAVSAAGGSGGRIVAFQEEKAIHPPFDRLFLRPEVAGGTAPGQVVQLYRPGEMRDGVRLPDTILGKAMVVRAEGPIAAAVTYELERSDLAPGDLFRPLPPGEED
jgi:hypothetical protein